jgi:hypothetical protein
VSNSVGFLKITKSITCCKNIGKKDECKEVDEADLVH